MSEEEKENIRKDYRYEYGNIHFHIQFGEIMRFLKRKELWSYIELCKQANGSPMLLALYWATASDWSNFEPPTGGELLYRWRTGGGGWCKAIVWANPEIYHMYLNFHEDTKFVVRAITEDTLQKELETIFRDIEVEVGEKEIFVKVKQEQVGYFIGKGGRCIKRLQEWFKKKIKVEGKNVPRPDYMGWGSGGRYWRAK